MTVQTIKKEKATILVPHDLFVRFLQSLGADVPENTKLHVYQSGSGFSVATDIHVGWDLSETVTDREVSLIADEDIELVAGMNET